MSAQLPSDSDSAKSQDEKRRNPTKALSDRRKMELITVILFTAIIFFYHFLPAFIDVLALIGILNMILWGRKMKTD